MKMFPYNYEPDKSIQVYHKTNAYLTENTFLYETVQNLGWMYHEVGNIIPQTTETCGQAIAFLLMNPGTSCRSRLPYAALDYTSRLLFQQPQGGIYVSYKKFEVFHCLRE